MSTGMTISKDYGERICMACKKPFTASYAAQVTCGSGCKKARRQESWRVDAYKRYHAKKARIAELELEVAALREENATLKASSAASLETSIRIKELEGLVESLRKQLADAKHDDMEAQVLADILQEAREQANKKKKKKCSICGGPTNGTMYCTACWQGRAVGA